MPSSHFKYVIIYLVLGSAIFAVIHYFKSNSVDFSFFIGEPKNSDAFILQSPENGAND